MNAPQEPFADTLPLAPPSPPLSPPSPPPRHSHSPSPAQPLQFTGSGSEYFRIWIVNLLLTLVTLGIYYPWAKVRRLRYFYGNTLVDGRPLDFHGDPKKMLKGSALVAVLFGLYSVAGQFSPVAGLVALLIVAAIAPALVQASLQFRMANTSWRGLRFRFTGSLPQVYRAVLLLYAPALLLLGLGLFAPHPDTESLGGTMAFGMAMVGLVLLAVALQPWTLWMLKKYQHDHYAFASLRTRFTATPGHFYRLALKVVGFALLVVGLPIAVTLTWLGITQLQLGNPKYWALYLGGLSLVMVVFVLVALKPYAVSRTQNLVWNHTGSDGLQFQSTLRFLPLLGLTVKNWLLVALTLGLYWPFAAVAMARLRLQAVAIRSDIDLDTLVGQRAHGSNEAAGDAAGDMLGFDLGL